MTAAATGANRAAEGADRGHAALTAADRAFLRRVAEGTWRSMAAMARPGGLVADGLRLGADGSAEPTRRTNPTNLASYLWSTLAAEAIGLIDGSEAVGRVDRTIAAIEGLETLRGFFLDNIHADTGRHVDPADVDRAVPPVLVSVVDNGWLAAGLIVVRNARPDLRGRLDALLGPMDFGRFYEPFDPRDPVAKPGLLRGSYHVEDGSHGPLNALLNTEIRIASYIGIASGQIPAEHYYRMGRVLPQERGGTPRDRAVEHPTTANVPVLAGHVTYRGREVVPSWGGSMFEALMVPLFVPEEAWAPRSWGRNHPTYAISQVEHGLIEAGYGVWGFSPCCRPGDGYRVYGVDGLGENRDGYVSNDDGVRSDPAGEPSPRWAGVQGVVTPHASFLALRYAPAESMANLHALADRFGLLTDFGFLDAVNVGRPLADDRVLALDQGMILAAIGNALAGDLIRERFSAGSIESTIRPLIAPELFEIG